MANLVGNSNDPGVAATCRSKKGPPFKLTQASTNHRRAARARAFAHTKSTPFQLEALNAQVESLQQTVFTLQTQVDALRADLSAVQANNVQALGPFVSVDPNPKLGVAGPHIIFSGANIHIVSGSGSTNDGGTPLGRGNLIIGYNEDPAQPDSPLNPGDRGGSHNLVIGARHRFTRGAFGGLVAGEGNTISNTAASVSGGIRNAASGSGASVSGGADNTASGLAASVSGGAGNAASGVGASVSGGARNAASGSGASVSGGADSVASGVDASVSGGVRNQASGGSASVSGGADNRADGQSASVSSGVRNQASGGGASVSGGADNRADGQSASVSSGVRNQASGGGASVSGGADNRADGQSASVIGGRGGISRQPESITASGNIGIGTAEPQEKLEVNGNIRTNGDILLTNADCAEDFDVCETEQIEPGTVMVLGDEGKLEPSQEAYDKRVAGVVSGAGDYKPGIVLDKQQSSNTRQPIALLGKVYCKVDAGHGAIEIGDLLTTSPTPGHAMKADDPLKAFGTVVGKALRPWAAGQGLIPILIALQ